MLIRKDQDILSFIKPLIESGYQVLFDNDGEDGEYYWIKVNHPHWDEARFVIVREDQYVEHYDSKDRTIEVSEEEWEKYRNFYLENEKTLEDLFKNHNENK